MDATTVYGALGTGGGFRNAVASWVVRAIPWVVTSAMLTP